MHELKKVIAVDFDGTLFEDKWPKIGAPIWPVIKQALAEKAAGAELILWTTREGKPLRDALNACKAVGLKFDAINSNSDTMKAAWGNDPRKIGATEYWDDRAVNPFRVPVKHGRWIPNQHWQYENGNMTMSGDTGIGCSVCGKVNFTGINQRTHYCPNCGARMDGEE